MAAIGGAAGAVLDKVTDGAKSAAGKSLEAVAQTVEAAIAPLVEGFDKASRRTWAAKDEIVKKHIDSWVQTKMGTQKATPLARGEIQKAITDSFVKTMREAMEQDIAKVFNEDKESQTLVDMYQKAVNGYNTAGSKVKDYFKYEQITTTPIPEHMAKSIVDNIQAVFSHYELQFRTEQAMCQHKNYETAFKKDDNAFAAQFYLVVSKADLTNTVYNAVFAPQ